jgi:hypothetical protein
MSNSFESVYKAGKLDSFPSREFGFEAHHSRNIAPAELTGAPRSDRAEANSLPAVMPTMTRVDAAWSPVFAYFVESFALYGASHCGSLNAIATSPIAASPTEAQAGQAERLSVRDRRGSIAIVYSSASPKPAGAVDNETNRAGPKAEVSSEDAGLSGFNSWPLSTDGSNRRNWLTRPWAVIASRWAHWRRERETKRAVAALVCRARRLRDLARRPPTVPPAGSLSARPA